MLLQYSLFLNRSKFGQDRAFKKRKRKIYRICTFCSGTTGSNHVFVVHNSCGATDNQVIIFVQALNKS